MSCPGPDVCLCDCHNGYQRPCSMTGGCGLTAAPAPTSRARAPRPIDVPALEADVHDLVRTNGYLDRLHALMPIPGSGTGESTRHTKVIGSPAPWNDEAAGLLFEVHAGARRHETRLRMELGWQPVRRGGTDPATVAALRMLPELISALLSDPSGLDRVVAEKVAADIERWPRLARAVLDDDPHADERPHTKAPGGLTCPYCSRPLILKHGWQHATRDEERSLWCLRCPSTRDDVTPGGEDLSWPASAWLAVLNQTEGTA